MPQNLAPRPVAEHFDLPLVQMLHVVEDVLDRREVQLPAVRNLGGIDSHDRLLFGTVGQTFLSAPLSILWQGKSYVARRFCGHYMMEEGGAQARPQRKRTMSN